MASIEVSAQTGEVTCPANGSSGELPGISTEVKSEVQACSSGGSANNEPGMHGKSEEVSSLEIIDSAQRSASAGTEDAQDQGPKEEEEEDGEKAKTCAEDELARLALAFFSATTKSSP